MEKFRPVVTVDSVDLVRGGRFLLRDVNLQIRRGEHWVLLGANGAGESTLLSLLGAAVHPSTGIVHVLGHQLGRVDMRELRAHIGHVNPRHVVPAPLSVRDVVLTGLTSTPEFPPRWAPTDLQVVRAEELVHTLGMGTRLNLLWPNLSQGERGRVLIARALMSEPELLLLDEPSTGLDLAAREQLLTSLDYLRAREPDRSSILVTHHVEEIPVTTTHAVLVREGVIVAQGPVSDVLTTANITSCFDHSIAISKKNGRWVAQTKVAETVC